MPDGVSRQFKLAIGNGKDIQLDHNGANGFIENELQLVI
jgi:hypothetical protein